MRDLFATLTPDEMRDAAEILARAGSPVAPLLASMADPLTSAEALRLRREALRTVWRVGFLYATRTAAARLIAAAWRAYRLGQPCRPEIAVHFAAMERAGVAPLHWRTIAEDLDVRNDRHRGD